MGEARSNWFEHKISWIFWSDITDLNAKGLNEIKICDVMYREWINMLAL